MTRASVFRIVPVIALALGIHASAAHAFPNYAFTKTTTKTDSFGTSDWAAGYTAKAAVSYDKGVYTYTTDDQLRASASLTGWARMFGTKYELVDIRGSAYGSGNNPVTYGIDAYITLPLMGKFLLYSNDWSTSFSISKSWTPTFFSASRWPIWVGPVPVKVSASAKGSMGFSASGTLGVAGLDVAFSPRVGADAKASAAVDVLFASAGIYGNLNLLSVRVPATGSVHRQSSSGCASGLAASWGIDVDMAIESLDGEMGVFATLGGERWEKAIIDWNGFSSESGIFADYGAVCL